jgi:hypothetical protein
VGLDTCRVESKKYIEYIREALVTVREALEAIEGLDEILCTLCTAIVRIRYRTVLSEENQRSTDAIGVQLLAV